MQISSTFLFCTSCCRIVHRMRAYGENITVQSRFISLQTRCRILLYLQMHVRIHKACLRMYFHFLVAILKNQSFKLPTKRQQFCKLCVTVIIPLSCFGLSLEYFRSFVQGIDKIPAVFQEKGPEEFQTLIRFETQTYRNPRCQYGFSLFSRHCLLLGLSTKKMCKHDRQTTKLSRVEKGPFSCFSAYQGKCILHAIHKYTNNNVYSMV